MPHGLEVVVVARFGGRCRWSTPPTIPIVAAVSRSAQAHAWNNGNVTGKSSGDWEIAFSELHGWDTPIRQSRGIPTGRKPPERAGELWLDPECGQIPLA
jgi:hypothetical protein